MAELASVVLERTIRLLKHEANLLLEEKDQIRLLEDDLKIMNAFLKDSAGKRSTDHHHHLVKEIVDQIKEATVEAENVVDTYVAGIVKQRRRNPVGKFTHFIAHQKKLHAVANKTTSIRNKIRNIYDNIAAYGIRSSEPQRSSIMEAEAEQSSLERRRRKVEENDVVGFFHDTARLVDQLICQGDLQLDVISIIGMGGLGKTTLARKIYRNSRVVNHFDRRAWVFVSQGYKVKTLLLDILKCLIMPTLDDEKYCKMSDEDLEREVHKQLRGKRYLIVMDDIWKTQAWEDVRAAFPDDLNGSRILITSREKEVASHASSTPPYLLPFLDNNVSWELLCKKVFRGGKCPSNLEALGRQLAQSCKGLPLSIVVLGGILAKKDKSLRVWSNFVGHVNSYLTEDRTRCLDILALSYNHLPHHLKPCFLYLGMFPEDYEIQTRVLIKLLIDEGFAQQIGNRKADDVAEDYLEELTDRSLIQVASIRRDGSVKTCRIHDLLRDLCIKESVQENFFEVHSEANLLNPACKPRRLSVHCDTTRYVSQNTCDTSAARSLLFFCQGGDYMYRQWEWFSKGFKFIRVLRLSEVGRMDSIPEEIGKLIFLRHLSIHGKYHIDKIPDSICSLPYLETIDIQLYVRNYVWPQSIWRMKQLRHLNVIAAVKILPPEPRGNSNDHDDHTLCNLQVIHAVSVDKKTASVIPKFPNLTDLELSCDDHSRVMNEYEATKVLVSLEKLQYLQKLRLNVFPKFELATGRLRFLPSTLTKVVLCNSYVDLHLMRMVGKLPNLRELKLKHAIDFPSKLSVVAGEFPQLQVFKLIHNDIRMWEMERDAMPNLEHLIITDWSGTEALPDQLWCITTLQRVVIDMRSANYLLDKLSKNVICEVAESSATSRHMGGPAWELTINNTIKVFLTKRHY